MADARWYDLGSVEDLAKHPLRQLTAGRVRIALSHKDGVFGAISGVCNHVGGPLGDGHLDGDYVVCPWHHWKFHCRTGAGEPGFEDDRVPSYALRTEGGRLFVNLEPATRAPQAAATRRIRSPARSSARRGRSACSASRPRSWTAPTRATRPPTRFSSRRSTRRPDSAPRRS